MKFPKLDQARDQLKAIVAALGPDHDISKVPAELFGDRPHATVRERVESFRAMNDEHDELLLVKGAAASGNGESGSEPGASDYGVGGTTRAGRGRPGPLASAIAEAGFDLRTRPSVSIPARQFFAAWVFPATADTPALVSPDIAGVVADRRYLFPLLPQEDLGDSLAIQDFRQTVETVTGTIERDPAATGTKATYDGTVTSVTDAVRQVALVAPDIPAALVNSLPAFNAWLETELSQQIGRAIDAHAVGEIVTATPGVTNVGVDPLFDAIRKALGAMRNAGANPSILVLNPTESESLDLTRSADGVYLRGTATTDSGPVWDLRVVETPSVAPLGAAAGPLVIDPGLLGVLFTSATKFEADPFSGFRNNLVDFRVEANVKMHVRNIVGARQIRN